MLDYAQKIGPLLALEGIRGALDVWYKALLCEKIRENQ